MSRGAPKRRYRLRRRRRRDNPAREAVKEGADLAVECFADDAADGEVVGSFGCCVVEAVGSVSILIGLVFVPAYLMLS